MNRFELTKRLVGQLKHEEAVIGGIGNTNFDLWCAGQRPQNFYMLGSMGLAIPIALGVAIAQPKRRVVALEGDGSLLMQLGCLATVAAQAPKNLTIVVVGQRHLPDHRRAEDGERGPPTSSKSPAPPASPKAIGPPTRSEFERLVGAALKDGGPSLVAARIDDKPGVGTTDRDPVQIRERFMRGLGVRG